MADQTGTMVALLVSSTIWAAGVGAQPPTESPVGEITNGLPTHEAPSVGVLLGVGPAPADSCPAIRAGAGPVTVDQLIRAIASSLNGCPPTS